METSKFNYTYTGDVASTVHHVVVSGNKGFSVVTTNGYDVKSGKLSSTTEAVSYYGTSASATVAKYGYDGLGRLLQVMRSGRAGASSYTYDLHGWPTGVKSKAFEEELFYTDGCGEPRYSGSISSVEWKNQNYPKLRGYMYYYDRLGRLESAIYGEGAGLTTNPNRYNETVLEYTANGAIERFQRRGLKQDGQYGKIDNLNITLDGNRVVGVEDDAAPLLYKGALDFTVSTESGTEYTYDGDGRLTGDRNRGIAKIGYDAAGNPRRVQYMDGSVTEYVYTAAGEKLRTIHHTAAPNVSVAFGQTKELTASETLSVDSTDYLGSLIAENGEAKIYNFGGGYCTFDGTCKFHYFDRDHQGNVRAVVGTAGTVEQIMNYYPFGAPYCDNTALNPDLQPYKYNGKEFETMHGRNAYDYGARFYDPLLPTWDRMDPLCEKYYHISPYAYCANDPVNAVDLDGRDVLIWYKDKQGNDQVYRFNGTQKTCINDPFIKDFIMAYYYMKHNGGGQSLIEAVTNSKYEVYVENALNLSEPETFYDGGYQPTVYWESRRGLETTDGGHQSAATRLDHEFNHLISEINNPHDHRQRRNTPDAQYGNKEERRVITGGEAKTAKANGESTRRNHGGKVYDTINPISIKEDVKKKHR